MDTERYIVAVEIGSSKITGAIGTRSLKGVVTVLGVDTEPLTGSVKRGFVVNPDEVSSKVKRLIRKLNNRIGASKKIKQVYVGIGGQSLHAEDHMISRDYPEGTPITEDIIKRLQEEAREMPIAGADILEVVRTGVLVDDKPKSGREEIEGSNLKMSLKLIVARDDLKKSVSRCFSGEPSVVRYIPTPLSTAYVALSNEDRQAGVMLEVVRTGVLVDDKPKSGREEIEGSNLKMSLKLIVARDDLKKSVSRCFSGEPSVVRYIPTPLSTAYVALSNEDRQAGVMLVDFGAETTTVSIYKDGLLRYLSTIPLGGYNITRDIMTLKVTEPEAESFKVRLGSAKVMGEESNITLRGESSSEIKSLDLSKVVKARIEEIVANVNAHFEYAKCDRKSRSRYGDCGRCIQTVQSGGTYRREVRYSCEERSSSSGYVVRCSFPIEECRLFADFGVALLWKRELRRSLT